MDYVAAQFSNFCWFTISLETGVIYDASQSTAKNKAIGGDFLMILQ